jgi:hypothetical protein
MLMVVPYICSPCGHGACGPCSILPSIQANKSTNGVRNQMPVLNVAQNYLPENPSYEITSSNVLPINTPEQFSPPLKLSNANNKQRTFSLKVTNTSEFHISQRLKKDIEENKSKAFISWPDRAQQLGIAIPQEQQNITEDFILNQMGYEFTYPPGWENNTMHGKIAFLQWSVDVLDHDDPVNPEPIDRANPAQVRRRRFRRAQKEQLTFLQQEYVNLPPYEIRRAQEVWRAVNAAEQRVIENEAARPRPQGYRWGRGGQRVGAQHLRHVPQDDMFASVPPPQNVNGNPQWRFFRHVDHQAAAPPQNIRPAPPIPAPNPNPSANGPPADPRTIDPEWLRNVSQAFGPEGVHQLQRENIRVIFNQTQQPPAQAGPINVHRRFPGHQPPEGEEYALNQERERRIQEARLRRMHMERVEEMEERIAARRAGREPRRASYPGLPGNAPAPRA